MSDTTHLTSALDDSQVGFFLLDRDWRITYLNQQAAENVGHSPSDLIGKDIWEKFPEIASTEMGSAFRRVADRRAPESFPWKCAMTDREYRIDVHPNPGGLAVMWVDMTEGKRAEAALRERERRFSNLFESMTEGLALHEMIFDASGAPRDYRFLQVNSAFERLTGLSREQVTGRTAREVQPGIEPAWIETYGRVVRTGEPAHIEVFAGPLGGFYEVNAYRPAPGQFVAAFRDVTEQRRAREELRLSEKRYRILHESLRDAFVQVTMDGRIVEFNDIYCQMLNYTPEEVRRLTYQQITPESWHEAEAAIVLEQIIPRGYSDVYEKEYRRKDGTVFPVELRTILSRDENGQPTAMWGIVRDITDRKRAEDEIRRARDRLEERVAQRTAELQETGASLAAERQRFLDVLDVLPAYVILLGPDYRIPFMNRFFRERFGDSGGARCYEYLFGRQAPCETCETFKALATGEPHHWEWTGPDGREYDISDFPFKDSDGSTLILEMGLDVSARKEAERRAAKQGAETVALADQLRELASELTLAENRERQRLAKVLHDHVQQLLVAAKLHTSILANGPSEAVVTAETRLVADLLDECLTVSRTLTAELSPPILHEGGLGPAITWLARSVMEKQGLTVEVTIDPSSEPVEGDVRLFLFEAVREVLFNVVKHAGVGRARVDMRRTEDGRIRVVVSDGGRGFDPAAPRVQGYHGGFGLFSIQQRLQFIGGRMEIESSPGHGARVTMIAPLRKTRPPEPAAQDEAIPDLAEATASVRGQGNRIRVLLADDHKIMRQGLAGLLGMEPDIEVVGEASNGTEAIALARSLRPSVVVMDVSMPRVNGIEATRQILSELPGIQVVGLSMHEDGEMAAGMREAGAVGFVTKGGPSEALIAAIHAAFKAPLTSGGGP